MDSLSSDAAWWTALTLNERGRPPRFSPIGNPARANRRWEQWRAQSPFRSDEFFDRRLALDHLDAGAFRALLGESPDALRQRLPGPPAWLIALERAYTSPAARGLPVAGPVIAGARAELARGAGALAQAWPEAAIEWQAVIDQLVTAMVARIDERISRAVVLQLRLATLRGELTGADASARFADFVDRLREPEQALRFLARYPVLARVLIESAADWTAAALELLERLCADWASLAVTFWPDGAPEPLTRIDLGLGDLHRGGREVCVLHFGSARRLLCKPRSLGVDQHFADLLAWLHAKGAPALRVPRTLSRGAYGWSEFVTASPCRDRAQARRFYRSQGALLAVLYVLNANDFHYANLLAVGADPVPVDLETLCGPDFGQAHESAYDSYAEYELANSVVNTMLLPFFPEQAGRAVDRSALGSRAGQLTPDPVPRWEHLGTADARLSFRRRALRAAHNRPELDGIALNAFDFAADIESGFTAMYRVLEAHREELPAGPLAALRADEVRVVFRATQFYGKILHHSFHPDHLRDALDRERLFDRLWFGIDRTRFPDIARRLLPAERQDLWRGEVPYFSTRIGSRHLWTSQGVRLDDFFAHSGWEMIQRRLDGLGPDDLHRQLWYIRASLSTLALNYETTFQPYPAPAETRRGEANGHPAPGEELAGPGAGDRSVARGETATVRNQLSAWSGEVAESADRAAARGARAFARTGRDLSSARDAEAAESGDRPARDARVSERTVRDRLLAQGEAMAEQVVGLARRGGDSASWLGLSYGEERGWQLHPLRADLYSGLPGVILFLSYAAELTGRGEFESVAADALITLRKQLERRAGAITSVGGFDGWGGLVYSWVQLARHDKGLLTETEAMVARIEDLAEADEHLDVVQGIAGAIVPLLLLHRATGDTRSLTLARRLGDRLVARAHPSGEGVGWLGTLFPEQPLTGFSHGASGFAWALTELFARTGAEVYAETALRAVAFERDHRTTTGNWTDLRRSRGPGGRTMTAWCHGATGIGLSRLRMRDILGAETLDEDLDTALRTTCADGFGTNHSLCHGDLGALELLLAADLRTPGSEWGALLAERLSNTLAGLEQHGPRCGVPLDVRTPGLMDGLAGIGYELLRLAAPDRIPSILLMEGPPDA
ncbi:type 2 lanthipeptide synthetase LanM family protein [Nocardia sp. NPDC048505]|uniref:type 2 lanthipeptide synthetase LanM family protein n=1 Tax=unclassified Nocardia TaxID=2637762 RepID=UPI0033FDFDBD